MVGMAHPTHLRGINLMYKINEGMLASGWGKQPQKLHTLSHYWH